MITEVRVSPQGKPSYSVIISETADFSYLIPFVRNKQILVVSNKTIANLYLLLLENVLKEHCHQWQLCLLQDGETYKNSVSLDYIYETLLRQNYTRDCELIALGGGVIGDITGFAAATYQRGVSVIQIPTTLLSQVDSSVGGKTAINHSLGKNMIGAFFQPRLVYTAITFLKTLPAREFSAGMAEVVKYGCIVDYNFFVWLEKNIDLINAHDPNVLCYAIAKACELKAQIVSLDEQEKTGVRALLNLGHTFGHAIECCQNYVGLKHGEAVAVGMVMATQLSHTLGNLDGKDVSRIKDLLKAFHLPIEIPALIQKPDFIAAMLRDKKNTTKGITLILLDRVGQAYIENNFSQQALEVFLDCYFGL